MEEEEYTDEVPLEQYGQAYDDEQEDFQDHQYEQQQEQQFGSGIEPREREGIFSFFRHILGMKDSTKVGNLDRSELGRLDLTVRNLEYLGKLGTILHNRSYNDYFMMKSEVVLATSMSKKGWLPELVVSQKKFSQRMVQPISVPQQKKGGFLGFGKKSQPQPQPQ